MSEAAPPLARLLGLEPPPPAPDPADVHAAGFAAGLAEARARQAAHDAAREEAHALALEAARAAAEALVGQAARTLAEAALALATAVLGARPPVAPDTLAGLVGEALAAAPREAGGRLVLPPGAPPETLALVPDGWELAEDPGLGATEVRAELGDRAVLASLEARLADLARLMAATT